MNRALILLLLLPMTAFAAKKKLAFTPVQHSSREIIEVRSGLGVNLNNEGTAFLAPSTDTIAESIIYKAGGRWPNPAAIEHCWVNPEAAPEIVGDLQNYVSAEYRKVGIGFVWRGRCPDYQGANEIRTFFKRTHRWGGSGGVSGGGGLSYLGPVDARLNGGTSLTGEGPGTMNIQIAADVGGYPTTNMRNWVINVTRATAVHEFGHALGLAHEQERNDAPICGDQAGQLANSNVYQFVGAYDRFSIMNYCKDPANISSLSEGDLQGLRTLYPNAGGGGGGGGGSGTGSGYIVRSRATNNCLDGNAWGTGNGTQVITWACGQNQANQKFIAQDAGGGLFSFKNVHAGRCLDVPGSSVNNGARMQLWDCNGTNAQKFRLLTRDGGWVGIQNVHSGKCLDVDLKGGYVQQWDCYTEANKQWGFFAVGATESVGASPVVEPK